MVRASLDPVRAGRGRSAPVIDRDNPWPGPPSYTEDSAAYFHGRDRERDEILRLVRREVLTVLSGQSGLGKTSLLNAAVFPALRAEDMLPVYVRLDYDSPVPLADQIWARLLEEAAARGIEAPSREGIHSLWEYLHQAETAFWGPGSSLVIPVIVLDQFEESFTRGRRDENVARTEEFERDFGDLVSGRVPEAVRERILRKREEADRLDFRRTDYKILLSLREDFIPHLESLFERARITSTNRMRLEPMTAEQALQAVEETGGHLIEPGIAPRIVAFIAKVDASTEDELAKALRRKGVEPSLLSIFCRQLNDERQKPPARERIGGDLLKRSQREILATFYADGFRDLDPAVKEFVEEKLLTGSGLRNSAALSDAVALPGVTQAAIDTLVERRLLRYDDRGEARRVELTHDVLTQPAEESRAARRLAARERELLHAQRRRRRQRAAAVAGVLGVSLMVWGAAYWSLREARDQRALAVAAKASADSLQREVARKDSVNAERQKDLDIEQSRNEVTVAKLAEREQDLDRSRAELARRTREAQAAGFRALVMEEVAQHNTALAGQGVVLQAARDSAFRSSIEPVLLKADSLQRLAFVADSLRRRQQQAVIEAMCVVPKSSTVMEPDPTTARLREAVRRALGIPGDELCTTTARSGA